jgi:hypothetical protein
MGFFSLKAECAICNKEVGLTRYQIANKKWICPDCLKKCGLNIMTPTKQMTVEDIKDKMSWKMEYEEELNTFNATKKISSFIEFDDDQDKWLIPDGFMGKKKNPKIYNYSDIVDFELLEDEETVIKGGLGKSIVGGVFFGNIGAIVGGTTGQKKSKAVCKSLKIKITLRDLQNPVVYINFLSTETKKSSFIYKCIYDTAQECLSALQLICNNEDTTEENYNAAQISSADEIMKFKNLMDNGVITKEEFEAKKKQLLGL